ncbi:MAG: GDSL-type esterase/lipase family protein [Verrucomicrobiia bacterium]
MLKISSFFNLVFNLTVGLALAVSSAVGADVSNAPTVITAGTSPVAPYPSKSQLLPGKGPMQTWAPFPEIWMQRRTEFQQQRQEDRGAIVFLGDSITQGWDNLAKAFPDFKVANRGIAGDTTRGVLYRLNEDVIDLKPKAVVLLIGTNDIGLGAEPDDVADNIKAIIGALEKSNPHMPIIFCEIMPSNGAEWNRPAATIEKVNTLVLKALKGDPQISVCNTWSIYADQNGNCSQSEFPDLLHPNAAGYALWAKALKPILNKLGLAAGNPK